MVQNLGLTELGLLKLKKSSGQKENSSIFQLKFIILDNCLL